MLANLSKTYKDLCVYNRTDKSELLADVTDSNGAKIEVCETPADVVRACDVTFSMLSTPEAVQSVFHEGPGAAILGASPGKQIVDCSTLQIQDMERTSKAMHERGALFLEAPVSGSKGPAEQGSLLFLCAGDEQVYQNPVATVAFDLMGRKAFFLGTLGNGTKMKVGSINIRQLPVSNEQALLVHRDVAQFANPLVCSLLSTNSWEPCSQL